ncbi:replication-relaxation family protein [Leucobacter sp. cx-328]|uniref:replication-relaxation family protein n=1 Tax=unclassified Leucobacter TaxID=2621730 RepID=UPI00165E720D|nr:MULTISPECIES: replication-relaxation family protein [unclassified Leucobacter]MBC9944191.1 replication-relaxation family protein [Leucobacter sp. cx-328]
MAPERSPYKITELRAQLTDRDLRVLEALERFRLLDTRLVQRLEFPAYEGGPHRTQGSATRTALRVLTRLEGHGLASRVGRRVGGVGHGSTQTVWHLGSTGERLLRALRGVRGRRRYVDPSHGFQTHTLAVARFAACLIEEARSGSFEILELQAEPATWQQFHAAHGGAQTLKPDLYVVTADSESETHSFVEIDLDTEHLPAIIRKCRLYQQHFQSGAVQAEHDGLYPGIVWVTPDEVRASKIQQVISKDQTLTPGLFRTGTSTTTLPIVAPYSPTV